MTGETAYLEDIPFCFNGVRWGGGGGSSAQLCVRDPDRTPAAAEAHLDPALLPRDIRLSGRQHEYPAAYRDPGRCHPSQLEIPSDNRFENLLTNNDANFPDIATKVVVGAILAAAV